MNTSPPIVVIEWVDAHVVSGWQDAGEILKIIDDDLTACKTVGYLLEMKEDRAVLAMSYCDDDKAEPAGEIYTIPKTHILSLTALQEIQNG